MRSEETYHRARNVAYLTGFFDADGCVSFKDNKKKRPVLTISQKTPEVLNRLQGIAGCGRIYKCGNFYQLRVSRLSEVKEMIEVLLPLSVVKREKLLLARTRV